MIELPDPASVIPADWRTRSEKEKREIYADAWSVLGANIAYRAWESRQPEWEQLVLPLDEFSEIRCLAGSSWCAPSQPEYALVEVPQ